LINVDEGVWPESKSFDEDEMGPIPDDWKGICQNEHDTSFHCNRSVITSLTKNARWFLSCRLLMQTTVHQKAHRRALLQQGLRGGGRRRSPRRRAQDAA
jgi:hypothetical protein